MIILKNLKKSIISSGKGSVIVTGPQRSGTTFTAKVLADMLGWKHVDEEDFGWEDRDRFLEFVRAKDCVIQAPCMSASAHLYSDQAYIVFMRRELEDIFDSQLRIKWDYSYYELQYNVKKFFKIPDSIVTPAEAKYYVWDKFQKSIISDYTELEYNSLKSHKLFIKKDKRLYFSDKQTSL